MSGSRSSSWRTRRLGDLLTYEQPTPYLVRSTHYVPWGRYPVLTAGKTFVLGYTNEPDGAYTEYPVIIFDDFTTSTKYVAFEFKAKSSAMKMLKARGAEADLRFMYERLQLIDYPIFDHKRRWIAEFSKLEVEIPSLKEQQAIARVAEDLSGYIAALERMIVKKEAVRQGMMQQLLSCQTRLPSFQSSWSRATVGEVADVRTGPFGSALHESDYVPQGTPIITVEHLGERGVLARDVPMVSDMDKSRLRAYTLRAGDVVFSRVGAIDRNALISESEVGWLFSGRLLRVRFDKMKADPAFMSAQFHSRRFRDAVRTVAVGQTMASLNTAILRGVEVDLPPLDEQREIGRVHQALNEELDTLEARVTKARAMKRGMMQQLLTGRSGLPVETAG